MSWHPEGAAMFRYRTRHEAAHARELLMKNNPSARVGQLVQSDRPANSTFECPHSKRREKCPIAEANKEV